MTQKKKERNYKKIKKLKHRQKKEKEKEIELTRHQRRSGDSAKYATATTIQVKSSFYTL